MALWPSPSKLFKAQVPDLKKFIGKTVRIAGRSVKIETIVGNVGMTLGHAKPQPTFYEINGKYLMGMLRFHCQMEGCEDEFTEAEYRMFETMELEAEKTATHPLDKGPIKSEVKSDG